MRDETIGRLLGDFRKTLAETIAYEKGVDRQVVLGDYYLMLKIESVSWEITFSPATQNLFAHPL